MKIEIFDYIFFPMTEGYTIEKTFFYALLLLLAVFVGYFLLKKLKLKIDLKLGISLFSFTAFIALLRSYFELKNFLIYWLMVPWVGFSFGLLISAFLAISLFIEKKFNTKHYKTMFMIGLLFCSILLPFLPFKNFQISLLLTIFYFPWIIFLKFLPLQLFNKAILSFHLLDATSTFIGRKFFGIEEAHVFAKFLISSFGPFSFVIAKFAIVFLILFLIDKLKVEKNLNSYIKIVIGIIGLGPAIRNIAILSSI